MAGKFRRRMRHAKRTANRNYRKTARRMRSINNRMTRGGFWL